MPKHFNNPTAISNNPRHLMHRVYQMLPDLQERERGMNDNCTAQNEA